MVQMEYSEIKEGKFLIPGLRAEFKNHTRGWWEFIFGITLAQVNFQHDIDTNA